MVVLSHGMLSGWRSGIINTCRYPRSTHNTVLGFSVSVWCEECRFWRGVVRFEVDSGSSCRQRRDARGEGGLGKKVRDSVGRGVFFRLVGLDFVLSGQFDVGHEPTITQH